MHDCHSRAPSSTFLSTPRLSHSHRNPKATLLPAGEPRMQAAFAISVVRLFFAADGMFRPSHGLHWDEARRMGSAVNDWPTVGRAFGAGYGCGIPLNTVAMQLEEKERRASRARTARWPRFPRSAQPGLRGRRSTQTRREEDGCRLPFSGVFFDVVASPLPPRGGGDRAEARRGGRSKLEEDEVLGLGLNLEPRPKHMLKMEPKLYLISGCGLRLMGLGLEI